MRLPGRKLARDLHAKAESDQRLAEGVLLSVAPQYQPVHLREPRSDYQDFAASMGRSSGPSRTKRSIAWRRGRAGS